MSLAEIIAQVEEDEEEGEQEDAGLTAVDFMLIRLDLEQHICLESAAA